MELTAENVIEYLRSAGRATPSGEILVQTLADPAGDNTVLGPDVLRWILAASFIGMACWMLIPDKLDENEKTRDPRFGVFGATVIAFFLAEMGDKTQIATIALAARYQALIPVVAGTTLGMLLADVPVVFLGDKLTRSIPIRSIHFVCAAIFLVLGILALFNVGHLA